MVDCFDDDLKSWIVSSGIHTLDYINFLAGAYQSLMISGDKHWITSSSRLVPINFTRTLHTTTIPVYKLAGFYCSDYMTPIFADTWENALLSAQVAKQAAKQAAKQSVNIYNKKSDTNVHSITNIVYALCCSPGHHASTNMYGGYCFINNAVVAAREFVELKKTKVGILDLDYHAGNGTADIVETNFSDCMVACSIHVDPILDYPSFESHETDNTGSTKNYVLPGGCTWFLYRKRLIEACEYLQSQNIAALVIAFGADTYQNDPDTTTIGRFAITLEDYQEMGVLLKNYFNLPIVITQEGGYDMTAVPNIVCMFLTGLMNS
jgi:acetoin utilization deacetylase AcuC-like enzyme